MYTPLLVEQGWYDHTMIWDHIMIRGVLFALVNKALYFQTVFHSLLVHWTSSATFAKHWKTKIRRKIRQASAPGGFMKWGRLCLSPPSHSTNTRTSTNTTKSLCYQIMTYHYVLTVHVISIIFSYILIWSDALSCWILEENVALWSFIFCLV